MAIRGQIFVSGLLLASPALAAGPPSSSTANAYCSGTYAESSTSLSSHARDVDLKSPSYTFCLRTVATYECPYYGSDGAMRRGKFKAVAHGTAFGYQLQGKETLLLTNEHVADWPDVTDDEHPVDGVPRGCKRISDALRIVENEFDTYERDDVTLSRVVSDPQLDVSILKAPVELPVMPWKVGKSSALRVRDAVDIRGFPLGALKATNVGKVVSAYDRDEYRQWDHDDFVIDAPLSSGNSGSPVLAISCRTGEFELVGIFHATYSRARGLNVVIAIDQVRDLMTTLKRAPRPKASGPLLDAAGRALLDAAGRPPQPQYAFPFGSLTAIVQTRGDGTLLFQVMGPEFPLRPHPILVLEDRPVTGGFGELGRIWMGGRQGLKLYSATDLDADAMALVTRTLDALRRDALAALSMQSAELLSSASREAFEKSKRLEKALRTTVAARRELAQSLAETADRLAPQVKEEAMSAAEVLTEPPAAAKAVGPPSGSSARENP
jgi:Trypsin-like peptidase domain